MFESVDATCNRPAVNQDFTVPCPVMEAHGVTEVSSSLFLSPQHVNAQGLPVEQPRIEFLKIRFSPPGALGSATGRRGEARRSRRR
ncbi:hypothetical protein VTJ04DRAFT_6793 [Mycothermus thermophilus]|uniref:uncharacterized protein n=1 Tax=Humicola insolens TaxID=85995 RepID=UPI003742FEA0